MTNLAEKGIETLTLDVTVPESIVALKDEISKRTGGTLDYLYNNAGLSKSRSSAWKIPPLHVIILSQQGLNSATVYEAPALEADPKQVRRMFDANVFGLFDVVTAFTPLLIAAGRSSKTVPTIVNVASILARIPFPFASAYNATKAAVSAYSDTLRLELSPLGIRVVTLFMGEVSTNLRSADAINFGSESLYADVESKVKERTAHSAKVSVTPEVFAKQVVAKILGDSNVSYIWKGTNAFIVWLLNAVGPRKVFDSTVMGPVGFEDKTIVKKIHDRGQHRAKER